MCVIHVDSSTVEPRAVRSYTHYHQCSLALRQLPLLGSVRVTYVISTFLQRVRIARNAERCTSYTISVRSSRPGIVSR